MGMRKEAEEVLGRLAIHVVSYASGAAESRQRVERTLYTPGTLFGPYLIYGSRDGQVIWHQYEVGYPWRGNSLPGSVSAEPLIVGDLHNQSVPNLKLDASFYAVPELISEVMAEANYKIGFGSFSLTPGVRYIKQFDNGAGEIGGASYSGKLAGLSGESGGYKEADSLDSQMVAARLVGAYGLYKLNLGYSQVFDEADLITPWRGFPTAGYTRSMARYNWMANTKSYRIELQRNANKKGIYTDLFIQASILHTDADESKGYFDENFYYVGFVQNVPSLIELQWRLRLGYTDTEKTDADSLDGRFELNYLF